jgi:hypothetical protein
MLFNTLDVGLLNKNKETNNYFEVLPHEPGILGRHLK